MRITAVLAIALLSVITLPALACDDITLEGTFSDEEGSVGETVTVTLGIAFEGSEAVGFSWGICHEEDMVSIPDDGITNGSNLEDLSFLFFSASAYDDGWNCGSLLAIGTSLDEGEYDDFLLVDYELLDVGTADLEWCETIGSPSLDNVVVFGDDECDFDTLNDGSIEIEEANQFLRGDINLNGEVSELTDALYLLKWQAQIGDAPGCMDAADVNDDGSVSPLLDALSLLRWTFLTGYAPPPAPGPEECGYDTTQDDLGCEEVAEDCE